MNDIAPAEKKPVVLPCTAALLCLLSFSVIGWAAPEFAEIYRDFGIDLPRIRALSLIHWSWTIPMGCLVAAVLIRGSRHWSRSTNLKVDIAAIILAIALFVAFVCTILAPARGLRSVISWESM